MSLENLSRIGQLHPHQATAAEVQRLLGAIDRNLADAAVESISDEARFDLAYKAVMQCALLGLHACGFRPSTSQPGHHQTAIQSLELTLGVPSGECRVLDTLRRRRNANDYSGDVVTPEMVVECRKQAAGLLRRLNAFLRDKHSELLA